ncbi:hypothetical protein SAMN04488518_104336 [Pseudovibrio ascidiaceicola]|uniref:Thoeris protein ThsA Macro domain-containing protein n=1 Tax=Pseudovibrio ascidiaceicola TaxID=285279 RepID=A0A1I3YZW7_9HYPH|nr:macro domain-containing protein [Pseudovibrio ascidiaceicola]SFK37407.1 hypothetical protein SAMN04488518_104336 [Pseudovibrio ascidiaceicola]
MRQEVKWYVCSFFTIVGIIWTLIEAYSFFNTPENRWQDALISLLGIFSIAGAITYLISLYPKAFPPKYSFQIKGTELKIELVVGDIFKYAGPIIVGTNINFITSLDVIDKRSIQGLYTKKFFERTTAIDDMINAQLGVGPHPYGAVARINHQSKNAFFCAIAEINPHGKAKGSMPDFLTALGALWAYLSEKGSNEIYNIPVLGTGFTGLNATREEVIHEIVQSFLASLAASSYCEGLRIVLYKDDVKNREIDVKRIAAYIKHNCNYAPQITNETSDEAGRPISASQVTA